MLLNVWATLTVLSYLTGPLTTSARHVQSEYAYRDLLGSPLGGGGGGGGDQKPLPLPPDNDGVHLAVGPKCGKLSGNTADINAGIDPGKIKTIVSFGDSYTDGGKDDGSTLSPPILVPPSPLAGVKTFLGQNNDLSPETTLYSIFFGINDYLASLQDGDHMPQAAQTLLDQIQILASPPTNARNFMVLDVYGRGTTAPSGEAFKQTIYTGLSDYHTTGIQVNGTKTPVKVNISYINFANIWDGVLGDDPGYKAFGFTSTDSCTQCTADLGCTTIGMCDDPNHYFYWIPGHPSKQTDRIMADYVGEVWNQCRVEEAQISLSFPSI
ncbi:hypothetical protein NP233_g7689 [Leucocoprinus birnbaumii]|uniref:Carbohydrate esterase family 16 protein n=1 Tax=Leucocoprinus birnbaumii TaxID=56174 RepID=A0AAD5YSI8_9AGAR|nr:hypothetical protein NP233_g7689 [Leucocoprinus birnbaumii]